MDILDDLQTQLSSYYDTLIIVLPKLVFAIVLCLILYFLLKVIRRKIVGYISKNSEDKLVANFTNSIFSIFSIILIILIFLYMIGLGKIVQTFLGAAGISAFVIGFALKDIGENFLAGVIMAFDRPFRIGDTVLTGNVEGIISEMSLRDTHIKTFDGKDVYVPNGQIIKNPLYNYTIDGFLRKNFVVGIDHESDIDMAREIVLSTIKAIPGVLLDDKPPYTLVKDLSASTINIEVRYWINTFDSKFPSAEIHSTAAKLILTNLKEKGIYLPGDILELKNYNNHSLNTQ